MKERAEFSPALSGQIVLTALDMNIPKKRGAAGAGGEFVVSSGRAVKGRDDRSKSRSVAGRGRGHREAVPVSVIYKAYFDRKAPVSHLEIINRIRSGLPGASVRVAQSYLGLQDKELAKILSREDKTIRSWIHKATLSAGASEQIFRLLKVYFNACSVLEDPDEALGWLKEPSEPLGGRAPLDLLSTAEGESLVNHELMQMEYAHPV